MISQENIRSQNYGFFKTDILFYKAFKAVRKNWSIVVVFHAIKALMFIIFFPLDYAVIQQQGGIMTVAMSLAIGTSIIAIVYYLVASCKIFNSVDNYIMLASQTNHMVGEEYLDKRPTSIAECVSTTVFFNDNELMENGDQNVVNVYTSLCAEDLNKKIEQKFKCLDRLETFVNFITLASMIFAIIALIDTSDHANAAEKSLLAFYVFLEGLSKLRIILVIFILAISPIFAFIFCIYACCCSKSAGEFIDLQKRKATVQNIVACGGQCSICIQNFKTDEDVYILPCSNKHMFHSNCLDKWIKIKNTCPHCREEIPMGSAQENN